MLQLKLTPQISDKIEETKKVPKMNRIKRYEASFKAEAVKLVKVTIKF